MKDSKITFASFSPKNHLRWFSWVRIGGKFWRILLTSDPSNSLTQVSKCILIISTTSVHGHWHSVSTHTVLTQCQYGPHSKLIFQEHYHSQKHSKIIHFWRIFCEFLKKSKFHELWNFFKHWYKVYRKWMILSVSESGSAPEIWSLSVGHTDTVSVRYAHWHCVSVSVH